MMDMDWWAEADDELMHRSIDEPECDCGDWGCGICCPDDDATHPTALEHPPEENPNHD